MAIAMLSWILAIPLLGVATGARSLTPIAVLAWYAYLGYLPVGGTWAAWSGRLWVAVLLTVLAIGELIGDKFAGVPNRTSPAPLLGRVVLGGLIGALCATAMAGSAVEGILLGATGALLGSYGGFMLRRDLSEKFQCSDLAIALAEDLFAIVAAIYALRIITE